LITIVKLILITSALYWDTFESFTDVSFTYLACWSYLHAI